MRALNQVVTGLFFSTLFLSLAPVPVEGGTPPPPFCQSELLSSLGVAIDLEKNAKLRHQQILPPKGAVLSPKDFVMALGGALNKKPHMFSPITKAPGYRVDTRPPETIIFQKGFWPHPDKPNRHLIDHCDNVGSCNFVSFSKKSVYPRLLPLDFFRGDPIFVQHGNELIEAQSSDASFLDETEPDRLIWVFYEYRFPRVIGTQVLSGTGQREKVIVSRGLPLSASPDFKARRILMWIKPHFSKVNGSYYVDLTAPKLLHPHFEESPWQDFSVPKPRRPMKN